MGFFKILFGGDETPNKEPENIVKPKNLRDDNMTKILNESGKPAIVDCWATWCVPCQRVAPIIDALANEYQDKLLVGKLNTEKNRKMAGKYQIRSIPTILFFDKNGKLVHKMVGAASKRQLQKEIESVLFS